MAAQYIPIKRISSLDTPIKAEKLDGSLFTTENQAHEFIISVRKNGVKQTVTGSVSGKFIRANGTTIFLQGSIVDGDAVVRLHQDCYNVQGRFTFNIFNTQSGVTTCIYSAVGKIDMGSTETVIDAGDVVPDVSDVVAAQEAAQATINAANTAAQTANTAAQNVGSIVARPYSSSSTYTAGDYCTNNGNLYKANQDISTAEEWTASHWTQIVMGDEVTDLKSAFNQLIDDTIEVTLGKNRCPSEMEDGYLESDGRITQYSDWKTTGFIDVSGYDSFTMTAAKTNNDRIGITAYFLTTYNSSGTLIEQVGDVSSIYTVGTGVAFIRFSFHGNTYHDIMVKGVGTPSGYEPYKVTYTAVNDDYALQTDMTAAEADIAELQTEFAGIASKDYQLYTPTFSLNPSAIENNGNLIDTLTGTKTTDYIDCSSWVGIRYTGASWLVCRALAFYDENHAWISSMPTDGDTTVYTNEIVKIPSNAKYVIFADLTAKQSQTLRIEVATAYQTKGKWTGKKWTCVGDSLTEQNNRTTMNYHDYVAQATGITVVNMGRSGTGYMHTWDEGYAFYQRVANVPTDSDVVTIFGSGNDLNEIADLGTPTDSGADTNPTTICGCINKTIDNLIALMPAVQLGIVSPTPWKNERPTLNNTNPMAQYTEALRQICYIRSIPFLDLYHESNLRPWTSEGRTACYSKDGGNGTHPDEAGHKIIASRFEGFLDSLLLGN